MATSRRLILLIMLALPAFVFTAKHPCDRACTWPPTPMTCRYTFTIEWIESMSSACYNCPSNITDCSLPGCLPMNGVRRPVVAVNQQIPGPPIQVCEDDTVVVKVWNQLGNSEGTSIHWHAIHHRGTPFMDGATMITQCPISAKSSFTYKFKASPSGTHWYHGHSQYQRLDGLHGSLIVNQAPEQNVHSALYDYDLPEHVVFIQAWTNEPSSPIGAPDVASFIINGKGRFNRSTSIPREVFKVQQGKRYRFRVIGNSPCAMQLKVQNHKMAVIAADASPIEPIVVDTIGIGSGERFDFVLQADQPVSNYWFVVEFVRGRCRDAIPTEYAVLRYEGAPDEEPQVTAELEDGILLNPPSLDEIPNHINILDLNSAVPDNPRLLEEPDYRSYLTVGRTTISQFHLYDSIDYPNPQVSQVEDRVTHINYNFFKFPSSPLLTQMEDIPEWELCTSEEVQAKRDQCLDELCMCIQIAKFGLNKTVEVIILTENGFHPLHLHGHFVQLVGQGQLPSGTTVDEFKKMDEMGLIPRKIGKGVLLDTFPTVGPGYTIVRFISDNPGQWFFHCHDIYHFTNNGMGIVFKVGETSDFPPTPKGFPRCGSWSPEDEEANDYDNEDDNKDYYKERKYGAFAKETKMRKQPGH